MFPLTFDHTLIIIVASETLTICSCNLTIQYSPYLLIVSNSLCSCAWKHLIHVSSHHFLTSSNFHVALRSKKVATIDLQDLTVPIKLKLYYHLTFSCLQSYDLLSFIALKVSLETFRLIQFTTCHKIKILKNLSILCSYDLMVLLPSYAREIPFEPLHSYVFHLDIGFEPLPFTMRYLG